MKDFLPYRFPAVIGNDVAGTVTALGEGVAASRSATACSG